MDTVDGTAPPDVTPPVAGPVLDGIPSPRGTAPEPAEVAADTEHAPQPPVRPRGRRLWTVLPSPAATPFTLAYATVLVVTSAIAEYADPSLVHALHQGSSTDVAHLVQQPVLVLLASALWIVGGIGSPYALGLVVVLTALERRIGGWRTAGVFLLGHVLATLATEIPVGLSVLAGHLPPSSLHRLDYGISFGVATSVGALAGLLGPWLRWPVLLVFGGMLVEDLIAFEDPMTNWGHLMALAIGVSLWWVVRPWAVSGKPGGRVRLDVP